MKKNHSFPDIKKIWFKKEKKLFNVNEDPTEKSYYRDRYDQPKERGSKFVYLEFQKKLEWQ